MSIGIRIAIARARAALTTVAAVAGATFSYWRSVNDNVFVSANGNRWTRDD